MRMNTQHLPQSNSETQCNACTHIVVLMSGASRELGVNKCENVNSSIQSSKSESIKAYRCVVLGKSYSNREYTH